MMPDDDHIIYFQIQCPNDIITLATKFALKDDAWWWPYHIFSNTVSIWHNHPYSWICTEKWCLMMTISYFFQIQCLDDIITLTVEFALKNDAWWWPYHIFSNIVSRWHNHCCSWICTEKQFIMHIHTYKTKKLLDMVSLITKWTPPLNSHWEMGPGHISYVPYWIK